MNLNNIILITDADGTFLTDDKRLLDRDMAAIHELVEGGGLFTIATGRGVSLARVVAEMLWGKTRENPFGAAEIPAVIFNGAAVYDFAEERFLWKSVLPSVARDYISLLMERFPTLGVEILWEDEVYVARSNRLEEEHLEFGCKNPIRCGLNQTPAESWIKSLLVDEPEIIDKVIAFSGEQGFEKVHMVRSSPIFYEMLPFGVNKGSGFKKLLEIMGLEGKYIVAAGDFMNDLEMLQMADLGVAVANAEESVKAAADLIVCDNNSGSIFEIVDYLKKL